MYKIMFHLLILTRRKTEDGSFLRTSAFKTNDTN